MNYAQAYVIFQRMPQEARREYVRLAKEGKTNLVSFVEAYQREQEQKELEKEVSTEVQESVAQNVKKSELLQAANDILLDISLSEEWWRKMRGFIEQAVADGKTEYITIVLQKAEGKDRWAMHAEVG